MCVLGGKKNEKGEKVQNREKYKQEIKKKANKRMKKMLTK